MTAHTARQSESRGVTILNRGTLAVIQSSTERVHWPQMETRVYDTVPERIKWLSVSSFDESTLEDFFTAVEKNLITAIVISASAMASATIRHQLSSHAESLKSAIRNGVGLALSAPYVTDQEIVDLNFIPSPTPVAIALLPATKHINGTLEVFGQSGPQLDGNGSSVYKYRSTSTARNAPGWTRSVTCRNPVTQEVTDLAWQTRVGTGFVFVSVLPLERLEETTSFDALIGRLTWSRGHLSIGNSDNSPQMPSPPRPSSFEVEIDSWDNISEFQDHFGHLRLSAEDPVSHDLPFTTHEVLRRSEKAGSLEIVLPSLFERPSLVKFGGTPRYLTLLRTAELKMIDTLPRLSAGPTFDVLAYSLCASEARNAVTDDEMLPRMLSRSASEALCREALRLRLRDGSVDGRILATANTLVSAVLSGIDSTETRSARKWLTQNIRGHKDCDELVQVLWVAHVADIPWLLNLAQNALTDEIANNRPFPSAVLSLVDRLQSGSWPSLTNSDLLSQTQLEAAMNAYTFLLGAKRQKWDFPPTPQYIELDYQSGSGEANFYSLAAAVLADNFAPLSTGFPVEADTEANFDQEREVASIQAVAALRDQAEAELERNLALELRQENSSLLILTRRLLGVVTAGWIIGVTVAAFVVVKTLFPAASLGDWLAVFTAGTVVIAVGIAIAANSPRISRALPGWARWLIRFSGQGG